MSIDISKVTIEDIKELIEEKEFRAEERMLLLMNRYLQLKECINTVLTIILVLDGMRNGEKSTLE